VSNCPQVITKRYASRWFASGVFRKRCQFTFLFLLVAGVDFLLQAPALAQAKVTVTPGSIIITATKGSVETRTIALRASEAIANPQIIPFDLPTADGSQVLPATLIQAGKPSAQSSSNNLVSIPIQFDLQNVSSGEFTGGLLVTYQGDEQVVPVIVKVKDPWQIPLLLLVGGVLLSVAVSTYSTDGKRRDEITVSIGNLRAQVEAYRKSARYFAERACECLDHALLLQQLKQLETAQSSVNAARATWSKWVQQKTGWQSQFNYCDTLRYRLGESDLQNSQALCIRAISRTLEETLQDAPNLPNPSELRSKLDEMSQQVNRFLQLNSRLEKLKTLAAQLEGDAFYEWEDKIDDLNQQLLAQPMSDEPGVKTLMDKIEQSLEEVKKVAQASQTYAVTKSVEGGSTTGLNLVPPPSATGIETSTQLTTQKRALPRLLTYFYPDADGRLRWFYIFSYLIFMGVLAGTGFNQLYLTKPTFGSWADYIAILGWGFGAEATRSAAVKALRKTDEASEARPDEAQT
jgi:hypothetical protein